MTATIWISGRVSRCIIRDAEGRVIDLDDTFNNIASTQSWLYDAYPEARQITIRDHKKSREMDEEWGRCKNGNG